MAWYECSLCKQFKAIRVQSVKPGTTIACGCVRREKFKEYQEQRAANLSAKTRKQIFTLAHHPNPRRRKSLPALAERFNLSKYTIDAVIAARCAALRTLAASPDSDISKLNAAESRWLEWDKGFADDRKYEADREAYLASLHWRDREVWLAAEAAKIYKGPITDEMRAILRCEIDGDVKIGRGEFTPIL